jgi:hypothetical protein
MRIAPAHSLLQREDLFVKDTTGLVKAGAGCGE